MGDVTQARNAYIDAPSKRRHTSADYGILIDRDDFVIRKDFYRLCSCSLQLSAINSARQYTGRGDYAYVSTNQERRFHESPGSEVSLGFLVCQTTISACRMCSKFPDFIHIATYISSYEASSSSGSTS